VLGDERYGRAGRCREPPFLTESIRIVNDRFTVTPDHVAHSEIAHETSAITKVLATTLLNQTETKSLYVAFITGTRSGVSNTFCLSSGLRVRERES
jgi:hypothetical protein